MSTTATRTQQYAGQFAALNDEVISTVVGCSDEQWRRPSGSEGWPAAVVAHHIAEVYGNFARILETLAAGETFSPKSTIEEVHRGNAQHAIDYAEVGKAETIDLLRVDGAALVRLLARLSDDQLERPAGVFGGNEMTTTQVVEWIVLGHTAEHLASLRATVG